MAHIKKIMSSTQIRATIVFFKKKALSEYLGKPHTCWEQGRVRRWCVLCERKKTIQLLHNVMRQAGVSSFSLSLSFSQREICFHAGRQGLVQMLTSVTLRSFCQVWLECVERSTICVYKVLCGFGWRTALNRLPCSIFSPRITFCLLLLLFI